MFKNRSSATNAISSDDAATTPKQSLSTIFHSWMKKKSNENDLDSFMLEHWGAPGTTVREIIMRYWMATRTMEHWKYLYTHQHADFRKYFRKGYMEPIPIEWVRTQRLAWKYPEYSQWETAGEKRLYYILNHALLPDGRKPTGNLRPLNITLNCQEIIRRGNARNAKAVELDPQKLSMYQSEYDVFHNDKKIQSHKYSKQVQNIMYETRRAALNELAEGIRGGTEHIETMLLLDVSGSMTWNPHTGITGPDGIVRYHDQPANIVLVQNLVQRLLNHMIPRAQKEHPEQTGISTVTFSSYGNFVGQLGSRNFAQDWRSKIIFGRRNTNNARLANG